MQRLLNLTAAYPWPIFALLTLTSVGAASQLHKLEIHISPQALTVEGDSAKTLYETTVETFGSDNVTVISLSLQFCSPTPD